MYVVTFYRDDPAPHYTTTLSLHDALPILLDLGDVLELGGQPGHAPQGLAVGQVQLLAVGLGGEGDGVHGGVAAGEDPLGQRVTPGAGGRAADGVLTCGALSSRYSASRDVGV